mmetsp:Transcript_124144/g.397341  ORF Transcript_124144/g.397341 Transcript_124144/m.397341 type:complete len:269 (-) Transcript_124144:963-1769(-)
MEARRRDERQEAVQGGQPALHPRPHTELLEKARYSEGARHALCGHEHGVTELQEGAPGQRLGLGAHRRVHTREQEQSELYLLLLPEECLCRLYRRRRRENLLEVHRRHYAPLLADAARWGPADADLRCPGPAGRAGSVPVGRQHLPEPEAHEVLRRLRAKRPRQRLSERLHLQAAVPGVVTRLGRCHRGLGVRGAALRQGRQGAAVSDVRRHHQPLSQPRGLAGQVRGGGRENYRRGPQRCPQVRGAMGRERIAPALPEAHRAASAPP